MTTLADFKQAGQLSLDELLTVIEQEEIEGQALVGAADDPGRNGHDCVVEVTCHTGHGINGGGAFPYICGFRIAGTTRGCPRRRRFTTGGDL